MLEKSGMLWPWTADCLQVYCTVVAAADCLSFSFLLQSEQLFNHLIGESDLGFVVWINIQSRIHVLGSPDFLSAVKLVSVTAFG